MNIPNEPGAWDADFSYGYLEQLYGSIQRDFVLCRIGDYPTMTAPSSDRPAALIRHDVDVSIDRAVRLAEWEADRDVAATYHVMIDSPFYDIRSDRSVAALRAIAEMGHEVGLHYDVVARGTSDDDGPVLEKDIDEACGVLGEIIGRRVRSLSFHRPPAAVLGGPLSIAGRVNGYAAELVGWYLSDSRARWREGNPIDSLAEPRGAALQILIHPIWWDRQHQPPAARLRAFLIDLLPAGDPGLFEELRTSLWDHVQFMAAEWSS